MAHEIKAGIKLEKDTEFKKAVAGVNNELKSMRSELKLVESQYDGNANSLEALQKKQEVLNKILDTQKRKVEETSKALENARKARDKVGEGLDKAKESYEKECQELDRLKKAYGDNSDAVAEQTQKVAALKNQISKGSDEYSKGEARVNEWQTKLNYANAEVIKANKNLSRNASYMKEAENATDKCAVSIDKFGRETKTGAEEIEALAGVLATSGVAGTVKDIARELYECSEAAAEFETGIAKVMTIADGAATSSGEMGEEILALSGEMGKSVSDLSEATYQAISAGVNTADSVNTVREASKLATGGFTDETTAVDILTTALNAYGLQADQTSRISDVLITTQNLGKTSVGELADQMGKVIPLAAAYNTNIENLSSGYAQLTANGIKTSEATTYIKAALNELGDSGSAVSKILQEETGKGFADLMAEGMSLGDVIQLIGDSVDGNAVAFNNLWSSQEAGVGMLSIFNSGAESFNATLAQMESSAGATDEAFQTMTETTEFARNRMVNALGNLKIAIGEELNPALNALYKAGGNAFEWATEFVQEHPAIVSAMVGLTAAVGTLTAAISAMVVIKEINKLLKAFNIALGITNPVGMATAIAGVAAAAVTYAAQVASATDETKEFREEAKSLAEQTGELKDRINESRAAYDETKSSIDAQYGSMQIMSDKLYELAASEDNSNAKKAQMQTLVDQLNQAIPDLNLAIDEQTGALNKSQQSVEEYIESAQKMALLDAMGERMAEIAREQADADLAAADAAVKQEKAVRKANEARAEAQKLRDAGTGDAEEAVAINKLEEQAAKYEKTARELGETIAENDEISSDCSSQMNELSSTYEKAEERMESASAATDRNTEAAGENADAVKGMGEANEESADRIAASSEAEKEALDTLREKYSEIQQSIRESMEEKISLFDMFDGGDDTSLDDMLANLDSQLEGLKAYKENMATLAGQLGDSVGADLYNALSDMGPSAANAVQEMVDALNSGGTDKLKQLSDKYAKALDFSDKASQEMSATAAIVKTALGEMGSTEVDFSSLNRAFQEAVQTAQTEGNEISATTRSAFEQAVQAAQACGAQIPEGLTEGLSSGEITVENAVSQLNGSVEAQFAGLSELAANAGVTIPQEIQAGISQGGDAAIQAIAQLNNLFVQKQEEVQKPMEQGGSEAMSSTGSGVSGNAGAVTGAVGSVMNSAAGTARSYYPSFQSAGSYVASGISVGIRSQIQTVANAAAEVVRQAKAAANKEANTHSPSRVFRDQVGVPIGQGIAVGITSTTKTVAAASTSVVRTAAATAVRETAASGAKLSAAVSKIPASLSKQLKKKYGVSWYEGSGKKKTKKSAKEYWADVVSAAEDALEDQKAVQNISLKQEETYWKKVLEKLKKAKRTYKQEWYDARKSLKDVQQEMKDTGTSGSALDMYGTYYEVSAKAEMQYWQTVRKQYKAGTEERIEADQKYMEAKENYYEKLSDLEERHQEEVEELTNAYKEAFEERRDAIKSSFGLFDEFASESEGPEKLLANMQSQVSGYALWMEQLQELGSKGILDSEFMEELQQMGPEAAATIMSLNMMTEAQLKAANEAYEQKNALAEAQAAKETESLRKETEKQIQELTKTYQKELAELTTPISSALSKLAKNASKMGEDTIASMLKSMTKKAGSAASSKQLKETTKQIKSGLNKLPSAGKTIGSNTLAGILEGMGDKLTIKKGAKSLVDELEAAIKKEAGIKSPSRRFREVVGMQIPAGVAQGIQDGTQQAADSGTEMIKRTLAVAQDELEAQQQALAEYAQKMDTGAGIAAVNQLISASPVQTTNVTIDNTAVLAMFGKMYDMLSDYLPLMSSTQVVLDTGTLVGELARDTGDTIFQNTRRYRG